MRTPGGRAPGRLTARVVNRCYASPQGDVPSSSPAGMWIPFAHCLPFVYCLGEQCRPGRPGASFPHLREEPKKRAPGSPAPFYLAVRDYCLRAIAELPSPMDFSTVLTAFMYIENSWLSAVRRAVAPAATFSLLLPASLELATMLLARSPSFSPSASAMACSQLVLPFVEPFASPVRETVRWARLFRRALNSALMIDLLGNTGWESDVLRSGAALHLHLLDCLPAGRSTKPARTRLGDGLVRSGGAGSRRVRLGVLP